MLNTLGIWSLRSLPLASAAAACCGRGAGWRSALCATRPRAWQRCSCRWFRVTRGIHGRGDTSVPVCQGNLLGRPAQPQQMDHQGGQDRLGMQLDRGPTATPALQEQTLGMGAAIARGAGIARQFPADGRRGMMQLPGNRSHAVVLLPQAGNGDAVFRLQLVIVRGGGWHLRTLQVGRCCTSLLNPPCNLHKCMSNAFRGVKRMAFEISQADLDNKMSGTPFNTGTIPAKK